jgi:hypothetical protein
MGEQQIFIDPPRYSDVVGATWPRPTPTPQSPRWGRVRILAISLVISAVVIFYTVKQLFTPRHEPVAN